MKTIQFFFLLIFILSLQVCAQLSERERLYDDSQVARIDIFMSQSAVDSMFTFTHYDSLYHCSIHFKNKYFDENVYDVAVRVRGNTSRDAQKKSIKIDFNEYVDRYFHSVSSFNVNGEHNDPSIVRSKLGWDFFNKIGITSSKAAHTELYINGKYYGLYINVEAVNKGFLKNNYSDATGNLWKCLYPADLNFLGNDPNLYKLMSGDRRVYELNSNEDIDDYSELANFIKIINQTPSGNLPDSLEKVFFLPQLIKYYAVNLLFGSWDDYWYLKNNYYLYHEPNAKKMHLIPYDYDNCLGVDWFNINWAAINPYNKPFNEGQNYNRPLVTRIMANNQYRNLYSHFLQFYNQVYNLSNWEARLDSIKQMLIPFAAADTMRTKDYGFTLNDFIDSYSASNYSNQHVKMGIKQFVNSRNSSLPSQLSYFPNELPIVYDINYFPKSPAPSDTIYIYVSAFCKEGLADIKINYMDDNQNINEYNMSFSPVANSPKIEEADRWVGKIPPLGVGGKGKFLIAASNMSYNTSYYPRYGWINIAVSNFNSGDIVLNEILSKNVAGAVDEAGDHEDWLELYNKSNNQIDLSGKYLTSDKDRINLWKIPQGITIAPKGYLLVWCDKEPLEGILHSNFKLSASGESVYFIESDSVTILDSLQFPALGADTSYGRSPDGSPILGKLFPTPNLTNSNILSVESNNINAKGYNLDAYPNPFNPSINISYNLPAKNKVNIIIYDALGREVYNIDYGTQNSGSHSMIWNGKNNNNLILPSGVYFCRVKTGEKNLMKKLVLIK